jgi:ribose transport system ATP-binding protein
MLRLQNIAKSFSGVKALRNISLEFKQGEVHALCGENGAGKSTLMNVIMGNLQPDEGSIYWKDTPVKIKDALAAQSMGIFIVYQEQSLADALSIAENIFPVTMPLTKAGLIDYPALYTKTQLLLEELGLNTLSPKNLVSNLSPAQKQMVEIARAIAQKPSLLILDEPTASITHIETEILFRIIQSLKARGTGVIYISHRMWEIQKIADKISVLKDGKLVGTVSNRTHPQQIISMMVGRELEAVNEETFAQKDIRLEVKQMSGKGFHNISFQIHKGEVVGFAGLQGSGRSAMAKAIFGDEKIFGGTVLKDGKTVEIRHPSQAFAQHIVYLPEERKTEGLFLDRSVAENIYATQLKKGFYNEVSVNTTSKKLCGDFGVRTNSMNQKVSTLSGGNQQKVVLVKCLALQPDILIVNEPTHGVDVGSKADIYRLLKQLTKEGKSILLISSELTELLLLSDRIAVMHEGEIQGILTRQEATEENITALASGINTSIDSN